jgi:hypothetical protein
LELRELKIPQVGRAARLLAAVFGLVFILAGTGMKSESPDPREPQSRNPHVEMVDLTLHDHLGEDQVSEQVTIHIDGRPIGTLTVNEYHPNAAIRVTVPKSGQYSYTAEAIAVFDIDG